jgi:hypothetical protein
MNWTAASLLTCKKSNLAGHAGHFQDLFACASLYNFFVGLLMTLDPSLVKVSANNFFVCLPETASRVTDAWGQDSEQDSFRRPLPLGVKMKEELMSHRSSEG